MRLGVAIVLTVLIVGVIAVAKLTGAGTNRPLYPNVAGPTSTVDPTAGDDGEVVVPTAYADDAVVLKAATDFTGAWLKRSLSKASWHAGLAPLSTATLAQSLEGVVPSTVPATRTTGAARILQRGTDFALVAVPVDTGTVTLSLAKADGRWLVSEVDWDRT